MKLKANLFHLTLILLIPLFFSVCSQKDNMSKQDAKSSQSYTKEAEAKKMPPKAKHSFKAEKKAYEPAKNARQLPFEMKDREKYQNYGENPRISPITEPVSTFSIDVDTASYTNSRRYLKKMGKLPPHDSVRLEEFVNYFDYQYPIPEGKHPFSIHHELAKSPFDNERHLLHVGIQGKKISLGQRPNSNLVFLLDVSGSMGAADKLPLLKSSLLMLSNQMTDKDKVSIVVYAGAAGVVLPPTSGDKKSVIKDALKQLKSGGSTAGGAGIQLAYKMAEQAFIDGGINRVILATDGDFNVGVTDHDELIKLIERKRKSGIALTVLGFGMYNLNDRTMEQLANKGNGNYFYIDNLNEARKVLVTELGSTIQIIAKDVKIQVEFNPKYVASYRLLGYENRKLAKEEFDDDTIDAGEIGAGHTVTAIYEITMTGSAKAASKLRYANEQKKIKEKIKKSKTVFQDEIAFFRLRYKKPDSDTSKLIEKPLRKSEIISSKPGENFLFSAATAQFAQKLRKSQYDKKVSYGQIVEIMQSSLGKDQWGYRRECLSLVQLAKSMSKY